MLWWWPPQENAFAQATPLLTSLTGTYGERFLWTLVGTRSTQSGRTEPRNYLLKMPPKDVVIVSNKVPLSIGMDGATLFGDKFKLLRGEFKSTNFVVKIESRKLFIDNTMTRFLSTESSIDDNKNPPLFEVGESTPSVGGMNLNSVGGHD